MHVMGFGCNVVIKGSVEMFMRCSRNRNNKDLLLCNVQAEPELLAASLPLALDLRKFVQVDRPYDQRIARHKKDLLEQILYAAVCQVKRSWK
jgi:hypothetical protein